MLQRLSSRAGIVCQLTLCCGLTCGPAMAQMTVSAPAQAVPNAPTPMPNAAPGNTAPGTAPTPVKPQTLPDSPNAATLVQTPAEVAAAKEAARIAALGSINGRPYDQPSHKDQFFDYLRDSYGWPAFARSTVRALYNEGLGHPTGWGQDFPGFMQRYGSSVAITAINGNVRFAMETVFSEDMKYIPCHGCSIKRKIGNTLLAEFTARHDVNGHRFFTLTPVISDFSGPIIANATWYPNHDPFGGVVATRTVFATRIGGHLFTEFVLERRHHDPKLDN